MATKTMNTVAGNTAPPLELTAEREGEAIVLSGCIVDLIITLEGIQTNAGHTLCTITDAANGIVQYVRQTGDLSTADTYICDLKVTYGNGTFEILYDQLKLKAREPLIP